LNSLCASLAISEREITALPKRQDKDDHHRQNDGDRPYQEPPTTHQIAV
jgi:hypothetical protein